MRVWETVALVLSAFAGNIFALDELGKAVQILL